MVERRLKTSEILDQLIEVLVEHDIMIYFLGLGFASLGSALLRPVLCWFSWHSC